MDASENSNCKFSCEMKITFTSHQLARQNHHFEHFIYTVLQILTDAGFCWTGLSRDYAPPPRAGGIKRWSTSDVCRVHWA